MVVNEVEHTLINLFRFLGNVTTLVTILSTSVLAILIVWLFKQRKARSTVVDDRFKSIDHKLTQQEEVSVLLLRFAIIGSCHEAIDYEFVTNKDLEQINLAYELYHTLGGNGYTSQLVNRVNSLPIKNI